MVQKILHRVTPSIDYTDPPAGSTAGRSARAQDTWMSLVGLLSAVATLALPLIASLIHEGRATQDASHGQDLVSPSGLSPEKNLSTLFGRVALTRSGGTATLDFYSLSKKICPELLFEAMTYSRS